MSIIRQFTAFTLLLFTLAGCRATRITTVNGTVAPGFEGVRQAFARNFERGREDGAALAVMYRGELVVDLWGGERNKQHEPWEKNTMVPVFCTTKGVGALVFAVAHSRGWIDYDTAVAVYWPEFAQHGKERITVRQLLSHEAGLILFDKPVKRELLRDLDALAIVLARQKPHWEPGMRHGYHLSTLGYYMNELFRRVHPAHQTIGAFLHDEVARTANTEFHVGLPDSISPARVAEIKMITPWGGLLHVSDPPLPMLLRLVWPFSNLSRALKSPKDFDVNDAAWQRTEVVSALGISSARDIARLYGFFAGGGEALGITPSTLAQLEAPARTPPRGARDAVVGVDAYFSLGFMKPGPRVDFGTNARAYGMPGAGGSFAFADPEQQLGYAYVMNKMGYYLKDDPREVALRKAVYAALSALREQAR